MAANMTKATTPVYVTEADLARLEVLVASAPRSPSIEMLEDELARATVVPADQIPPNVVTMNSRVRFKDLENGEEVEVSLVYPKDADATKNRISVLAPIGSALLGLTTGAEISWPVPSGKRRLLKIEEVLFQPEAEGQFHL